MFIPLDALPCGIWLGARRISSDRMRNRSNPLSSDALASVIVPLHSMCWTRQKGIRTCPIRTSTTSPSCSSWLPMNTVSTLHGDKVSCNLFNARRRQGRTAGERSTMKDGSPLPSFPTRRRSPACVHILNRIGSLLNVHLSTAVCKLNLLPQSLGANQKEHA